MKLHIHNFRHNTPIAIDDIIESVSYNTTPEGIIRVRFTTKDKYYSVDGDWTAHTAHYRGRGIEFMPYIWDGENYLDPYDGYNQGYYDHPDWWMLKMVLECDGYYVSQVFPLKHEYLWVLVPYDVVFGNYKRMKTLEVVGENTNIT